MLRFANSRFPCNNCKVNKITFVIVSVCKQKAMIMSYLALIPCNKFVQIIKRELSIFDNFNKTELLF